MKVQSLTNAMKHHEVYDYIFTGLGASSCILIHEFQRKGLLSEKKILILDPSTKNVNDKTYCFWSAETDEITRDLAH